jgi:hypothetical protein
MMQNPWTRLPSEPPFVLDIDRERVEQFNAEEKRSEKHRIHTELLPEPYLGDPFNASVFLLNLNPGYSPDDVNFYDNSAGRQAVLDNLTHMSSQYPFFMLNPDFKSFPGPSWWLGKLEHLIKATSLEQVAKKVFCVEFSPYHSQYFGAGKLELESQWYSFDLVQKAIEDKKIIIVMRAEAHWKCGVPGLRRMKGNNYYRLNSTQNVTITRNNLPDGGFDRIVEVIKS